MPLPFSTKDATVINFISDIRHRRITETVGAVAPVTLAAYTYDLAGRLKTAANADAISTRSYDLAGRLTSDRQQHLNSGTVTFDTTVSRGYEASGMLSSVTDAFGTTDYVYNQRGLLSDVNVDGTPPAYTFTYDGVGRRISSLSEIGVTETRNYDDAGQLLNVAYRDSANVLKSGASYTLDNVGLRTGLTRNAIVGDAYGYDANRQVTAAEVDQGPGSVLPATPQYSYTYDPAGNRTSGKVDGSSTVTNYATNPVNAYTSVGGVAQVTDLNGNLTNDGTRSIAWSVKDRISSVTKLATNTIIGQYRYDAFGRRIFRQYVDPADNQTKTIRYVYDGWNVTTEHDGTGVLQRRNIWGRDLDGSFQGAGGVGGLLMVEDRSNPASVITYHSCYDGNGNIVEVLTQNTAGAVTVAQNRYFDAFGKIWGGNVANGSGPHR